MIEQPKSYLKILALLYDTEGIPIDNKHKIDMDSWYLDNLAKLTRQQKSKESTLAKFKSLFVKR